LDLQGHLRVV
jgi:hypothetical protein